MEQPKAFLFDMDGLLLDSERVYRDVAVGLMADMGIPPDQALSAFLGLVGTSGPAALRHMVGFAGSQEAAEAFNDAMHRGVRQSLQEHVPLRPTVRETLAALAEKQVRMAVVTSTHAAPARDRLQRAGLRDYFDFVVAGDEVRANKPDPAPYLQAAATFGLEPTACAAFEDSDPGTTSAAKAGCRTTQIPDLRPPGRPFPDVGQQIAPDLWTALSAFDILDGPAPRGAQGDPCTILPKHSP